MNKKVVVLGGGSGLSALLKGLKLFPLDITAVVSVCDDGKSTGRLREEFQTPAVGDIRRVLISLSETEPLIEELLNYRFDTMSDLNGHAVGNLLLTALINITGNMSDGIESLGNVLNLKGRILPLTEDSDITLMANMTDGSVVIGEHHITESNKVIKDVFYQTAPQINPKVVQALKEADLILLSMGSLYTSIIPNLICQEIKNAIDQSSGKIMYTCNMMTQPGETDGFTASNHVKLLNKYLGNRKIDAILANRGEINDELKQKYETLEQKDPVVLDIKELTKSGVRIIASDFVSIEDNMLRHNAIKLASYIFSYLL